MFLQEHEVLLLELFLLFEHQGAVGSRRDGSLCPAHTPTSSPVQGAGAQLPLLVTFDSPLTFFVHRLLKTSLFPSRSPWLVDF